MIVAVALGAPLLGSAGCGDSGKDEQGPGSGSSAGSGDTGSAGNRDQSMNADQSGDETVKADATTKPSSTVPKSWFSAATASHRVALPVAGLGAVLNAQKLAEQLAGYDPGSLLRCAVADDAEYRAAIDALGGVTWGYGVQVLEDLSKPRFQSGLQRQQRFDFPAIGTAANAAAPAPVQSVKADIVAVTDEAALFYSKAHGLMLVDLTGSQPQFVCATPLPGIVDRFFFHEGRLVAMTKQQYGAGTHSFLLHFNVTGVQIDFVEAVDLGEVNILDSRRFNERLVFYTDLHLQPQAPQQAPQQGGPVGGPVGVAPVVGGTASHRSLRVFTLGDHLVEEMHDTLIDTTISQDQLLAMPLAPDTAIGTVVNESHRFGDAMWASDHYFAVTEETSATKFNGWQTQTYSVCTKSHVVETTYTQCTTRYETRPNPDYTPPDNPSGDRACKGITLADCLRQVARVSNPTIEVPVGTDCVEAPMQQWICDQYEQQSTEYPTYTTEVTTQLYIYEYTDDGFVRIDTKVFEITNPQLAELSLKDPVSVLTTSTQPFDLAVPGRVQTLYFMNGILYVISEGVLQVYTVDGGSMVRTATLPVVNQTLQSTLFSDDKLILSDFGWKNGMDESTLKVIDLSNPAFPKVVGTTYALPGGHSSILLSRYGIFTIGQVTNFDAETINAVKLGLFSDPYAAEQAYLILATELANTWLHGEDAHYFSSPDQRLVLPYWGQDNAYHSEERVSLSHIIAGEIVSEGHVLVPEPVQRVRPRDGSEQDFLTFADNSIEWLTPHDASSWDSTPVLEYFQPVALLRLNDQDDYMEVQRLGERCKLFFSNARDINQRDRGLSSEEFTCHGGQVQAYDHTVLGVDSAVEWDDLGKLRELSEAERADIQQKIANRETCLLSMDLVDDVSIDYTVPREQSAFTCVGPTELQMLIQQANNAPPTTP